MTGGQFDWTYILAPKSWQLPLSFFEGFVAPSQSNESRDCKQHGPDTLNLPRSQMDGNRRMGLSDRNWSQSRSELSGQVRPSLTPLVLSIRLRVLMASLSPSNSLIALWDSGYPLSCSTR
jgi:hypothetical protein